MTALRVPAPAKINLVLRILGRREDGYHDLDTLFQAISLGDEVTLRPATSSGIHLTVVGADVGPVGDNLAFRAAQSWSDAAGIDPRVTIRLSKRVPAGAGLGGGSSDAGAVLRGLEAMHGAPLGPSGIAEIGSDLGADVPFFCGSAGLARGEGIGERLTPLPALPVRHLIVAVPPVPVPTAGAYGWLAAARAPAGPTAEPAGATRTTEAADPVVDAVRRDLDRLSGSGTPPTWHDIDVLASNDFHDVVADRVPDVGAVIERLEAVGLDGVLLSGSGGAVFGFLPGDGEPSGESERVVEQLRETLPGVRTFAVRTLPTLPPPEPVDADAADRP